VLSIFYRLSKQLFPVHSSVDRSSLHIFFQ